MLSKLSFSFFNNLSDDMYYEVVTNLSSEDLLTKYKNTSVTKFLKILVLTLCSRQDQKSIECAKSLFIADHSRVNNANDDSEFVRKLKKHILLGMKSQFSNIYHKLSASLFMSNMSKTPIKISDSLIQCLLAMPDLNKDCYLSMFKMFTKEQKNHFGYILLLRQLMNSEPSIIMDVLETIAHDLDKALINDAIILISLSLNDNSRLIRYNAIKSILHLGIYTNKPELIEKCIETFYNHMLTRLNNTEYVIRIEAIEDLEKISFYLNKSLVNRIFELIKLKLNDSIMAVKYAAIESLLRLAHHHNKVDIIDKIIEKTFEEDIIVSYKQESLEIIARYANQAQKNKFITYAQSNLNKRCYWDISILSLQIIMEFAPCIQKEDKGNIISGIKKKLKSKNELVLKYAAEALGGIAHLLNKQDIKRIITYINRTINNSNHYTRIIAIRIFAAISQVVSMESRDYLVQSILEKLNDDNAHVRIAVLEELSKIKYLLNTPKIIDLFISRIRDASSLVREKAYMNIPEVLFHIDDSIIEKIIERLDYENNYKSLLALLKTIRAIIPRTSSKYLNIFVEKIGIKLKADYKEDIYIEILNALSTLAIYIDNDSAEESIISSVLLMVNDKNSYIRIAAFNVLANLVIKNPILCETLPIQIPNNASHEHAIFALFLFAYNNLNVSNNDHREEHIRAITLS